MKKPDIGDEDHLVVWAEPEGLVQSSRLPLSAAQVCAEKIGFDRVRIYRLREVKGPL